MRISKSTKTDVKASIDTEVSSRLGDALRNALIDAGFSKRKAENMGITELMSACHEAGINCDPYIIKAREASSLSTKTDVNSSTSTDKALQHIKAAIDILGKSGDKDEVTKDSIANLGVVMFDLKSKK